MIYSNWHQTTATQFSGVCHLTMFEKKGKGGGWGGGTCQCSNASQHSFFLKQDHLCEVVYLES